MAGISYIGKPISLISHSDIRYRGILHGIDPVASTISLANVISMGTENRRPAEAYIPPSDIPYEFIIFRASEVKDIAVDQVAEKSSPGQRNVHDDPAVMSVSVPPSSREVYPTHGLTGPSQSSPAPPVAEQNTYPHLATLPTSDAGPAPSPSNVKPNQRPSAVDTATTGMENVQRAMGELRVSNGETSTEVKEGASGRRGKGPVIRAGDFSIPTAEFDFAKANARFDKAALGISHENSEDETNPSDSGENKNKTTKGSPGPSETAYNPKASFFDSLGSSSRQNDSVSVARGGRGSRRGRGSSRREEERQRNVATFGEPGGGPGLMGPGAYVPGWGGSGRRGQGRGRRGGPRPPQ